MNCLRLYRSINYILGSKGDMSRVVLGSKAITWYSELGRALSIRKALKFLLLSVLVRFHQSYGFLMQFSKTLLNQNGCLNHYHHPHPHPHHDANRTQKECCCFGVENEIRVSGGSDSQISVYFSITTCSPFLLSRSFRWELGAAFVERPAPSSAQGKR